MNNTVDNSAFNADILLLGESAADQYLLIQILCGVGYRVRREKSVDAALAAIEIKKPDLILISVNFAGSDAYEVCKKLKSEPQTSIIPVIFLIPVDESRGRVGEFLTDGIDFITTPFQPEDVLLRVNNTLKMYYLGKELKQSSQSLHKAASIQRETEMSLQIERKRLITLFHFVGDGIICTDDSGLITMLNESAKNLTGWLNEEAIGQPVEKVFRVIIDVTQDQSENIVKKVLETGRISEFRNLLLIPKVDNMRRIEVAILPVIQAKRKLEGAILVFGEDTEERKKSKPVSVLNSQNQVGAQFSRRNFDSEIKKLDEGLYLPFAFVMADVKGLRTTSKSYGQKFGEILLEKVFSAFRNECRPDDIVVRVGEEKFVILMSVYDAKNADILISRLNKAVSTEKIGNVLFSLSVGDAAKSGIYEDADLDAVLKKVKDDIDSRKLSEGSNFRNRIILMILNRLFDINELEKSHSLRISRHAAAIAEKMNFSESEVKQIALAGLVHDIGKIGIDGRVLTSKGALTNEDWKAIQRNPEIGYRILITSNEFYEIANIVLEHHEQWDGKGYPRGICDEEISLQARIIAVANTYDSLISKRLYKREMRKEAAINELKRCAGTQFDPEVVSVFIEEVLSKEL